MKKTISTIFIVLVFIADAWTEELRPEDFARALVLETDGGAAIYELSLPVSVYASVVRKDLGDIRVFNANEEIVPHTLRSPEPVDDVKVRVELPFFPLPGQAGGKGQDKLDAVFGDDGAILTIHAVGDALVTENAQIRDYIIDLSAMDRRIKALEFELNGAGDNYVKKLSIDQSENLIRWRRLISDAALTRLLYGSHELQRKRIAIPQGHQRYLRFRWHDASDGIQLDTVYALLSEEEDRVILLWESRDAVMFEGAQSGYQFDTGGTFPLEQFTIALAEQNTLVEARVLSRANSGDSWRQRYAGVFYNLLVQGEQIKNDVVRLRTLDDRYWLLQVNNNDGLGKVAPQFRFGWSAHSLLFLARGPAPYTLAYGSGKAAPSGRPVAMLLDVLDSNRQAGVTGKAYISGMLELSGEVARDSHFDISWQRTILWALLAAGVVILGLMAFRLLRQLND